MGVRCKVPQLRFGEFSGEWEEKKLGEISNKVMYGIGSSAISFDGENKYLRITDIDESSRKFIPNPLTSPDGIIEEKHKLKNGDIVFARTGASVGKSYLYNSKDGNLIYAGFLIKFHIQDAIPYFVYANTFREYYNKWVQVMSIRSGQPGINAEEYKLLPINLPSKQEQEKIASFLSAVDSRIEQLTKKEQLLREYKKGVMQKIFSQELRFKDDDGSEFPEWVEKRFEEIFNRYDNLRIPVSSSKRISGNTPYYGANGIQDYIEGFTHDGEFILIAEDGANDLKNYPVQYVNGRIWVNNHAHVLQAKKSIANNKFLKDAVSKINFEPFLVGGGRAKLNANIMMKISLNLPSLKEQTKIANFLSSIDTKIEQVSKELNLTKEFKKALLQKMFV